MKILNLTIEQERIIDTVNKADDKLVIVSASAGSGKTFTLFKALEKYYSDIANHIGKKALVLAYNSAIIRYFNWASKKITLDDFGISLNEIVDAKTSHSFLKSKNNMDKVFEAYGVGKSEDLDINYTKSRLTKKDIKKIVVTLTNDIFKNVSKNNKIPQDKLKKFMSFYASNIQEEVKNILDIFLKSEYTLQDKDSGSKIFADANIDYNLSKLKIKAQLKNPEYFFLKKLNDALDKNIKEKKISVWHSYYYKKIYDYAYTNDDFLKEMFSEYNFIALDEAQDADKLIFNLLHKYFKLKQNLPEAQNTKMIFFGDSKQSIYSFNGLFNVFEWSKKQKDDYILPLELSESFRFGQQIAEFAQLITTNSNPSEQVNGNIFIDSKIEKKGYDINDLALLFLYKYEKLVNDNKHKTKKSRAKKISVIFRTNKGCMDFLKQMQMQIIYLKGTNTYENCTLEVDDICLDTQLKKNIKTANSKNIHAIIEDIALLNKIKDELDDIGIDSTQASLKEILSVSSVRNLIENNATYSYLLGMSDNFFEKYMSKRTNANPYVIIATAHAYKGKESDIVILGDDYCKRKKDYFCDNEECRISHVAITRAKKELYFYLPEKGKNYIYDAYRDNKPLQNSSKTEKKTAQSLLKKNLNIDDTNTAKNDDSICSIKELRSMRYKS